MDNIGKSDFKKICRICLKLKIDVSQLYDTELINRLYESVSIKILQSNDLPNSICKECTEDINTAFKLKQLCTKTQQILENFIKTENFESDSEDNTNFYNEDTIFEDIKIEPTVISEPKVEVGEGKNFKIDNSEDCANSCNEASDTQNTEDSIQIKTNENHYIVIISDPKTGEYDNYPINDSNMDGITENDKTKKISSKSYENPLYVDLHRHRRTYTRKNQQLDRCTASMRKRADNIKVSKDLNRFFSGNCIREFVNVDDVELEECSQLYGKNYSGDQMVHLKYGIYCRKKVYDRAVMFASKVTHILRRLMEGVFIVDNIQNCTPPADTPASTRKKTKKPNYLNPVAINAIKQFSIELGREKGMQKVDEKEMDHAICQKLYELKYRRRPNQILS